MHAVTNALTLNSTGHYKTVDFVQQKFQANSLQVFSMWIYQHTVPHSKTSVFIAHRVLMC